MSEKEAKPVETKEIATLDVRDASDHAVALMRKRVENQEEMLKIAIKLTGQHQWVMFGESLYPTGGCADTILRRAFGLHWGEKTITIEDTPDGKLATCTAWLMQDGRKVEAFTGYRLMTGFIKNEADLRRAVLENLKSVAVRDLLGLRFRTPEELKHLGLDVTKLEKRVDFQEHDKQGSEVIAPFGKQKGKPLSELNDENLQWLAEAVKKSVEDPTKEKWKAKNQALVEACREEYKRRRVSKEEEKKEAKEDGPPPPVDPETGEVIKDEQDFGPKAWDEKSKEEPGL